MEELLRETTIRFEDATKKPQKYLGKDEKLFQDLKDSIKLLYDGIKGFEDSSDEKSTLKRLIVKDFDEEQVWAGIQLQNEVKFSQWNREVQGLKLGFSLGKKPGVLTGDSEVGERKRKLSVSDEESDDGFDEPRVKKVSFAGEGDVSFDESEDDFDENDDEIPKNLQEDVDEYEEDEIVEDDEEKRILQDPDFQNMSDSDGDDLPLFENAESEEEEEKSDEDDMELEEKTREIDAKTDEYMANAMKNIKCRSSEVDDQFFKLSEMEQFLEVEDKRFEKNRDNHDGGADEMIDMFEEDETDRMSENNQIMYKDYFQNQTFEKEKTEKKGPAPESKKPLNIFEYDDDNDSEEEELSKSTHEKRQERLKNKIEKLEAEAIGEKPWQMTGEVSASKRPENSLLQDHLDFDTISKQAPIITEKVSKTLEELIIQRIKDKAWDDVERKIKPVKDPYEYKKKLVLDQEKSKLSLAEVYEQEYLQQQGKLNQENKKVSVLDKDDLEVPKEVDEIRRDMDALFAKLDVLTHYYYTPKSASADIKVIKNKSTLQMEEIAPVGITEETLLAPQEVADKTQAPAIGSDEKTDTDRNRERRKKKKIQKQKAERLEKIVKNANPGLGNKYAKERALKSLEEAGKKGQNIKIMKSSSEKVKSSAAFFDKLQNQVQKSIHSEKTASNGGTSKKKNKKSSQLKL